MKVINKRILQEKIGLTWAADYSDTGKTVHICKPNLNLLNDENAFFKLSVLRTVYQSEIIKVKNNLKLVSHKNRAGSVSTDTCISVLVYS
jgi:hypothetical protein